MTASVGKTLASIHAILWTRKGTLVRTSACLTHQNNPCGSPIAQAARVPQRGCPLLNNYLGMADPEDNTRPTKRQRLNAEYSNAELDNMCCSICAEPFVDPVSLRGSGHTYCRACITQALANQRRCPLSNARITIPRRGGVDGVLDPNHQVRSMIDAQRVACAHAARGCTERPKLGDVEAHEASCAFAPKKCLRCPFLGSRAETEAHERSCPYVVLGPVLDAQANRIESLERKVSEQDRTNERLITRLDALEQSNRQTVTPASARRPPRDVVKHADLRWARSDDYVLSKEDRAVEVLYDCVSAKATTSFDTGTHAWTLLFTKTDGCLGVGVSYCGLNGKRIELSLYIETNEWQRDEVDDDRDERDSDDLARADAPWAGYSFEAGSVLNVTYVCETGTLSVGHDGGNTVSITLHEFASKRVAPFVCLTEGNACEFFHDVVPARPPPLVEHRGLTFDAGRCIGVELSEGDKDAVGHGDAVASEVFDSGKHLWKLRFPVTDRMVGVGICTEDRDLGVALNPSANHWFRGEVNGESWISRPERIHTVAQIPWRRDFRAGSVLEVSFDCDTGTLSVGLAGSEGAVSLAVDELVSKRVSPFVFLTHCNCCEFVD